LASVIQSFGSIGFGLIIGFINSWELTLFVLAFAPFMLITGFVRVKIVLGTRGERNKNMEEAAKVWCTSTIIVLLRYVTIFIFELIFNKLTTLTSALSYQSDIANNIAPQTIYLGKLDANSKLAITFSLSLSK